MVACAMKSGQVVEQIRSIGRKRKDGIQPVCMYVYGMVWEWADGFWMMKVRRRGPSSRRGCTNRPLERQWSSSRTRNISRVDDRRGVSMPDIK